MSLAEAISESLGTSTLCTVGKLGVWLGWGWKVCEGGY